MPTGALSAPPPTPVPVQVTGVVAVGLIVPPAGLEAAVLLNAGKMPTTSAIIKVAAMNRRNEKRVLHGRRVRFANLVTVGIISSTPAQWRCKGGGGDGGSLPRLGLGNLLPTKSYRAVTLLN